MAHFVLQRNYKEKEWDICCSNCGKSILQEDLHLPREVARKKAAKEITEKEDYCTCECGEHLEQKIVGAEIILGEWHNGTKDLTDEEKAFRRNLPFPITKQYVYYKDKMDKNSIINVLKYRFIEAYETSHEWFTMELLLQDNSKVIIHSGYFVEMQKPSFIEDMKKLAEQLDALEETTRG